MYSTGEISPDAMQKLAGNKGRHTEGQCTGTPGSTRERNWVVGSQILTYIQNVTTGYLVITLNLLLWIHFECIRLGTLR